AAVDSFTANPVSSSPLLHTAMAGVSPTMQQRPDGHPAAVAVIQAEPTLSEQIPPKLKTLAIRICSKILVWRESAKQFHFAGMRASWSLSFPRPPALVLKSAHFRTLTSPSPRRRPPSPCA